MGEIELRITWFDWMSVFLIGLSFALLLSTFGYYLLTLSPMDGAIFGSLLGFFITGYSLIFITTMNRYLLPKISKKWWNGIAASFSFISGFLGTLSTYWVLQLYDIERIDLLIIHPFRSAMTIGILTYLIGALIYQFVKARNEKEHIDTLFIQSRIASLETQLNPHFLFNALNSLAELIHTNPDKAENAVIKMSEFLRNTMKESPLISLEEELQNVQDYIELENLRFSDTVTVKIDEDIPKVMIPKFSIQLLCENAIKHSMSTNKPFLIMIKFSKSPLSIEISNNGKAVSKTQFGIGLSNLSERLKHLCKGEVKLIQNTPPTYQITLKECYENSYRR